MKALKLTSFLILTLIYVSCEKVKNDDPFSGHVLYLSFQDASGNDLVEGIGYDWLQSDIVPEEEYAWGGRVNPDLYTLKIIFPEGAVDVNDKSLWSGIRDPRDTIGPTIVLAKPYNENMKFTNLYFEPYDGYEAHKEFWEAMGGYYRLWMWTHSKIEDNVKKLIFRITCPYIFGDDQAHDIVTYWRKSDKNRANGKACYRIEFEGKEVTDISYADYEQMSFATIVLDR